MRLTETIVPCLVALAGTALAPSSQAACYTVYRQNAIVYRSIIVPVDLSRPLHQTVPAGFGPGTTMVIAEGTDGCRTLDTRRGRDGAGLQLASAGGTPRATARSPRRAAPAVPLRLGADGNPYIERVARPIRSEVGVANPQPDEPSPGAGMVGGMKAQSR